MPFSVQVQSQSLLPCIPNGVSAARSSATAIIRTENHGRLRGGLPRSFEAFIVVIRCFRFVILA